MTTTVSFSDLLAKFLLRTRSVNEPVAYDDPQRDPNYCWTHNMIYPDCAGMH